MLSEPNFTPVCQLLRAIRGWELSCKNILLHLKCNSNKRFVKSLQGYFSVTVSKPLNAKPTKWSNTLKQFASCCRERIHYINIKKTCPKRETLDFIEAILRTFETKTKT